MSESKYDVVLYSGYSGHFDFLAKEMTLNNALLFIKVFCRESAYFDEPGFSIAITKHTEDSGIYKNIEE